MPRNYILKKNSSESPFSNVGSTEWIFIDTETDGLTSPIHIVEIAAQKFCGLEPVGDPFQAFINHGIVIPLAASEIHGYTTDFIRNVGRPPKEVYGQFRDFVGNSSICAHFLQYDWNAALVPELTRLNEPLIGRKGFCSWGLSRRALPELKSHNLDHLRETFNLRCSRPHTATGDIESVVDLMRRIIFPRLALVGYDNIESVVSFSQMRPILKSHCIIQGRSFDEELQKIATMKQDLRALKRKQEIQRREIERVFGGIVFSIHMGVYPSPEKLVEMGLMEEMPLVEFECRSFQFTGKMRWGSRSKAIEQIILRGGSGPKSKRSFTGVDYLVLGEDPDDGWMSRSSKLIDIVEKKLNDTNLDIRIILESDFIAALCESPPR